MVAGCPRTVSHPPEEMISLGMEMIQWIQDNDKELDILHLSEWYSVHKMFTYNQWKAFIQRPEFLPYYEKALKLVGKKYLDKTSNIRDGIAHRFVRVYFKDVKEQEDYDEMDKEEREFKRKLALIDHQAKQEQAKLTSPYEAIHDLKHENMIMKDENRKLRERLADKS